MLPGIFGIGWCKNGTFFMFLQTNCLKFLSAEGDEQRAVVKLGHEVGQVLHLHLKLTLSSFPVFLYNLAASWNLP